MGGEVPAIGNGNDAGSVLGNFEEHGHCKIEVWAGRVTPAAIVIGESVIRWAEVSCGYEDGWAARVAPLLVIGTLDFKARTAAKAIAEKCGA